MSENLYGIQYKDGSFVKLAGKTFQDAYSQNGRKTKDGNIDFSILDFYLRIPVPFQLDLENEYMLFVMRDKKSNWEPAGEIFNSFSECESLMKLKVRLEGFFSALVIDMRTEKPVSWIWSR